MKRREIKRRGVKMRRGRWEGSGERVEEEVVGEEEGRKGRRRGRRRGVGFMDRVHTQREREGGKEEGVGVHAHKERWKRRGHKMSQGRERGVRGWDGEGNEKKDSFCTQEKSTCFGRVVPGAELFEDKRAELSFVRKRGKQTSLSMKRQGEHGPCSIECESSSVLLVLSGFGARFFEGWEEESWIGSKLATL